MSTNSSPKLKKRLGRPKTTNLEICRRIYWAWKVREALNLDFAKIERKLYPDCAVVREDSGGFKQPQLFLKYSKGLHSPIGNGRNTLKKPTTLDLSEKHAPGSKAIYESILWQVLSKRSLTITEIKSLCQQLGTEVQDKLKNLNPNCRSSYKAIQGLKRNDLNELAQVMHIDTLAVILLIEEINFQYFFLHPIDVAFKWIKNMTEGELAFSKIQDLLMPALIAYEPRFSRQFPEIRIETQPETEISKGSIGKLGKAVAALIGRHQVVS
jgi:hypothetical protein